jgi:predicted dehydrogenase
MFDDERLGTAVETQASVTMRLAGGALAHVTSSQTVPYPANDLVVQGTDGRIVGRSLTRAGPGTLTVTTRDGERTTAHPQPDAHRRCVTAFTRAVLVGEVPDASGIDGLHSVVLCDAIARSVAERRRVDVPGPAGIPLLAG